MILFHLYATVLISLVLIGTGYLLRMACCRALHRIKGEVRVSGNDSAVENASSYITDRNVILMVCNDNSRSQKYTNGIELTSYILP